jgi:pimeloyl-ACP methyl ester carboxylesterase
MSVSWTQTVTIPSSVPHGRYYVGILVTAGGDAVPGNNALADTDDTAILSTSLGGTVTYKGQVRSVAIRPYSDNGSPVFDNVPTWIVIHGRNSSPIASNLAQLAASLDGFSPSDQVLTLDWSSAAASGAIGGAGENYIKPVAKWAAAALAAYGLDSTELNLVGHSWGAYVAAELAELQAAAGSLPAGKVNSIVALDPATDYPGGSYNPTAKNEVNFARNSRSSWAFYAYGGLYGSATVASTAHESVVVTAADHSKLVNVFADLVTISYAPTTPGAASIGTQFNPNRLLAGTGNSSWKSNSYTSAAKRSSTGTFEAVIIATSNGLRVKSLKLYNGRAEIVSNA